MTRTRGDFLLGVCAGVLGLATGMLLSLLGWSRYMDRKDRLTHDR